MTQKLVDFENPLVKTLLARNLNIDENKLKHWVMPTEYDTFTLGNVIYKVVFVRNNPFRFSAEPIGIITDDEMVKKLEEVMQPKQNDSGQPPNHDGTVVSS